MIDHATVREMDFVEACWVDSQRSYYAGTPDGAYYPWMRQLVRKLLKRALVLVERVDGVVVGYIVAESTGPAVRVHHLYVRKHERREGRGFRLLAMVCSMLGGERLEYTCRVIRAQKYERRPWTVKKWCDALSARFVYEEADRESA